MFHARYIAQTITIVAVFCIATVVFAQTPTPHPNALDNGFYDFTELTSPDIELSLGGWSVGSDYLRGSGAYQMEFYVTDNTDFVVMGATADHSSDTARFDICVVAVSRCWNMRFDHSEQKFIELYEINSLITITRDNNNMLFHFMELHAVQSAISGTQDITTESTPAYIVASAVSGTNGDVDTEFHYVVTAGDVAISTVLIILFFSLCAFIIIMMVFRSDVRK